MSDTTSSCGDGAGGEGIETPASTVFEGVSNVPEEAEKEEVPLLEEDDGQISLGMSILSFLLT